MMKKQKLEVGLEDSFSPAKSATPIKAEILKKKASHVNNINNNNNNINNTPSKALPSSQAHSEQTSRSDLPKGTPSGKQISPPGPPRSSLASTKLKSTPKSLKLKDNNNNSNEAAKKQTLPIPKEDFKQDSEKQKNPLDKSNRDRLTKSAEFSRYKKSEITKEEFSGKPKFDHIKRQEKLQNALASPQGKSEERVKSNDRKRDEKKLLSTQRSDDKKPSVDDPSLKPKKVPDFKLEVPKIPDSTSTPNSDNQDAPNISTKSPRNKTLKARLLSSSKEYLRDSNTNSNQTPVKQLSKVKSSKNPKLEKLLKKPKIEEDKPTFQSGSDFAAYSANAVPALGKAVRGSNSQRTKKGFPVIKPLEPQIPSQDQVFGKDWATVERTSQLSQLASRVERSASVFEEPEEMRLLSEFDFPQDSKFLGAIRTVGEFSVTVSLPHNNNVWGYVSIRDISSEMERLYETATEQDLIPMSTFYAVGDLVLCTVSKGTDRPLKISFRPEDFNKGLIHDDIYPGLLLAGSIVSIEDKGCVINLGTQSKDEKVSPRLGFLRYDEEREYHIGQTINCIVVSGAAHIIQVADLKHEFTREEKRHLQPIPSKSVLSLQSLLPGMFLDVGITKLYSDGLYVRFNTYFGGLIDPFHLGDLNINIQRNYKLGQRLKARILFVDSQTSRIYLTLKPNLLKMNPYPVPDAIQESQRYARSVVKLKSANYLWIQLSSNPPQLAMVDSLHLTDKPIKNVDRFRQGTEHSCKILGFNFLDGYPIGSLKKKIYNSLLNAESDLTPGVSLDVTTIEVNEDGSIKVQIHDQLFGLIKKEHVADLIQKIDVIKTKYKPGKKLRCRVISCHSNSIHLTHKLSLVNSDLVLSSFEDVQAGDIVEGWVSKKTWRPEYTGGLIVVHFFDHLKGQVFNVPRSRFDELKLAQTVKCRVLQTGSSLVLSFDLDEKTGSLPPAAVEKMQPLVPGQIVPSMKVLAFSEKHSGFILETADGRKALLPKCELTDFLSLVDSWASKYRVGDAIGPLLITGAENNSTFTVTKKASLLKHLLNGPTKPTNLSKGNVVWGTVDKVTIKGCEVTSLYPVRGYISIKNFPSHNTLDPKAVLQPGQTVRYSVIGVPEADSHQMVMGSLKPDLVPVHDTLILENYIEESEQLKPDSVLPESLAQRIGSIVWVKIQKITYFGATLKFQIDNKELKSMTGVVLKAHMSKTVTYETGQTYSAKILDIDASKKVIDVSLTSLHPINESTPPAINQSLKATIELIKTNYLVFSLESGHIVYGSVLDRYQSSSAFSVYTQEMRFDVMVPVYNPQARILCYVLKESTNHNNNNKNNDKNNNNNNKDDIDQPEVKDKI